MFFSELIHEGTHAKEAFEIEKLIEAGKTNIEITEVMGNNWSSEKRAYFHERSFQKATEMNVEYESIEDMLQHIKINYKPY